MNNQLIQPDKMIDELMTEWPQTIGVFLKYNMGCVGCSMAAFEKLSDALAIYALPVQPFIEELHLAIRSGVDHE